MLDHVHAHQSKYSFCLQPARHSKLEKADILEMTVKHLQNLQRQQAAMSAATDPSVIGKFRAGFSECASEVGRFPGLDPTVKRRLLQHLANVLNQGKPEAPQVQVHILPNPAGVEQPTQSNPPAPQSNSIILSNGNGTSLHLVPTRLPNGDIALVLPTAPSAAPASSPLPLLVPIPTRTASNASASSASSGCSSVNSGEPMETQNVRYASPPMQKPLSLVVKKCQQEPQDDDKPWRPW